MKIEVVKIDSIKLNEKNPRVIKDEKFKKLVESIKNFPEMLHIRPIVVNKKGVIIGGNHRYLACKEAGKKEVPIIRALKLTKEQESEFMAKDNINAADWDFERLGEEFKFEDLEAWGMETFGFDPEFDPEEFFDQTVAFKVKGGKITFKYEDKKTYDKVMKKLATFKGKKNEEILLELLGL